MCVCVRACVDKQREGETRSKIASYDEKVYTYKVSEPFPPFQNAVHWDINTHTHEHTRTHEACSAMATVSCIVGAMRLDIGG